MPTFLKIPLQPVHTAVRTLIYWSRQVFNFLLKFLQHSLPAFYFLNCVFSSCDIFLWYIYWSFFSMFSNNTYCRHLLLGTIAPFWWGKWKRDLIKMEMRAKLQINFFQDFFASLKKHGAMILYPKAFISFNVTP